MIREDSLIFLLVGFIASELLTCWLDHRRLSRGGRPARATLPDEDDWLDAYEAERQAFHHRNEPAESDRSDEVDQDDIPF